MAEHGVRYLIVKVEACNVEDFEQDVYDALDQWKVPVSFSSARFRCFENVEVEKVMLAYEYKIMEGLMREAERGQGS